MGFTWLRSPCQQETMSAHACVKEWGQQPTTEHKQQTVGQREQKYGSVSRRFLSTEATQAVPAGRFVFAFITHEPLDVFLTDLLLVYKRGVVVWGFGDSENDSCFTCLFGCHGYQTHPNASPVKRREAVSKVTGRSFPATRNICFQRSFHTPLPLLRVGLRSPAASLLHPGPQNNDVTPRRLM